MVNIKKIDDFDLVFINRPETEEELKAFSEFLKKKRERKEKLRLKQNQKIAKDTYSIVN